FQLLVIALVSGSTVTPAELRDAGMAAIVQPWDFNFAAWEVNALWEKARAFAMQPTHRMDYATSVELVHDYLARAQTMQALEQSINNLLSGDSTVDDQQQEPNAVPRQERIPPLQEQLEALRHEQEEARSSVEQIIERQISTELSKEGLTLWGQPFPPVQFTFVEPPRKLVVSPRARITTEYSQMLDATMSLEEVQRAERDYFERFNSSAYITNIGGLGAFPTMVVDRAPLSWILSTVAHEWTHNYLTLFPLGFNYMTNADFITMNETVAEIVGNELGEKALRTFYPELVPPPVDNGPADGATNGGERIPHSDEPHFDFDQEMHETRLVVDQLLAHGKVEEAEQYMAERRLYFVANGYPLRVLNQAYFAFHGSYGTSAASTSPIGPQMEALRAQSPNLKSFLETVRTFTSPDDITRALAANAPRN
ncbi:MAG: hypothetical protein KDE47_31790, partial [Caldilineaceae bacterium]|nr:hypothetical protein [Caldilineaceae bacterium]